MIRVQIVAGSPGTRVELQTVLERDERFVVIDCFAEAADRDVDVVVVVSGESPFADVELRDGPPAVLIVPDDDPDVIARWLNEGARAVLPRDAADSQIQAAVAAAAAGLVTLPVEFAFVHTAGHAAPSESFATLTPRESEVLSLIAGGLGNKVVAARLGISEHTVKSHVESIFEKLGVSSRAEAVARGMQLGVIFL